MSWFNKKRKQNKKLTPQQRTDQVNKTIQDLKSHQTLISKKTAHLQKQIEKYNNEARACMKQKNKKGALIKIRLRKQVEKRIETLDNQSLNVETQIMTLDQTLLNQSMITVMKNSNKAMKQAMAGITVEDVDAMQEEINEAMELHEEMNDVFSRPLIGNDYDDDELLAELDDIMEEENEDILLADMNLNMNNMNINVNVNGNKNIAKVKVVEVEEENKENIYAEEENSEEEEELRKLEMEINMAVMSAVKDTNELIVPQIACR